MSRPMPEAIGRELRLACLEPLRSEGVMQNRLDAGIPTRRGVMCTHREEAYAADYPVLAAALGGRARSQQSSCCSIRR